MIMLEKFSALSDIGISVVVASVKSSILLSYQALIILSIASLKNLTVAIAMLKFFALLSTKLSSTYTT
jgi:hypothetical protein